MKRHGRIAAMLLTAALVAACGLSALAGCSGGEHYDPDNFLPNGTEENPYQIVKEPVTIDIFSSRGGMSPRFEEMKMFKKLSQLTNLNFNFNTPDSSAYQNVRTAQWEDRKNLPDLFLFSNPISELVVYSGYGAFVPFNDPSLQAGGVQAGNLIDNYMPNYKALLDENFHIDTDISAKEVATFADGKMYVTLSVSDVPRDLTYKMFFNQQWIENLREDGRTMSDGSEIPDATEIRTVEQLIDILRMFKKYDANHNGNPNDEIPVTSKSLEYLRNFILASYGYVFNSVEVSSDGSEIVYVPKTEAYRKYLETMHLLYSEGLLDNSTFEIKTDAQLAVKGLDGDRSRLGMFCAAAAYIIVGADRADEYVAFGPLTSSYYTGTPLQWGFSYFVPDGAAIPAGTPYVREIARLLDLMYSDLGVQLISYGEEGVDWTWDDAAHTSWTFHVPENWTGSQEEYRATITPNVGTASALYWSYDFVGKMNDATITSLNRMSERYTPYLKVPYPPEIKLTGDQYNRVEVINSSLESQLSYLESNFIVGNTAINDAEWSNFVGTLDRFRAQELTEIYNGAYQAYRQTHR